MSFETLKPEIWDHVLYFLTPSLPKPVSGWTKSEAVGEIATVINRLLEDGAPGTVGRKDIRAQGLTVLMRTSVAFNHHASRALYGGHVISDNLSSLIDLEDAPSAHPSILSKAEHLRMIQSLHLEYNAKNRYPSYLDIMNDSPLAWVGITEPDAAALDECIREGSSLSRALPILRSMIIRAPFPKLQSVSIGSIFGGQDDLWRTLSHKSDAFDSSKWTRMQSDIASLRHETLGTLILSTISHCCTRGTAGPLSLPPVFVCYDGSGNRPRSSFPLFPVHFDLRTSPIPTEIGRKTRWIFEEHCLRQIFKEVMLSVSDSVVLAKRWRDHGRKTFLDDLAKAHPDAHVDPRIHLEIYASGDRYPQVPPKPKAGKKTVRSYKILINFSLAPDLERAHHTQTVKGIQSILERELAVEEGKKDNVQWLSSPDSPYCEACNWRFGRGEPEGVVVPLT